MYLSCKYDPFNTNKRSTAHIPDGASGNLVTMDYKDCYDISTTGPGLIRIWPSFPFNVTARFASIIVNGTQQNGTTSISPAGVTLAGPRSSMLWQGLGTQFTGVDACKARFITTGWRLMYTGTAANAAGYVQVGSSPLKVDASTDDNPRPITFYNSTGTVVTQSKDTCAGMNVDTADLQPNRQSSATTAYVGRIENGAHGVLLQTITDRARSFKSIADGGTMVYNGIGGGENVQSWFNGITNSNPSPSGQVGVYIVDDDFGVTDIYLSEATNVRLEVISCIEWAVTSNSQLNSFAVSGTTFNEPILKAADITNSKLAVANPMDTPLAITTPRSEMNNMVSVAKNAATQAVAAAAPSVVSKAVEKLGGAVLSTNKAKTPKTVPKVSSSRRGGRT